MAGESINYTNICNSIGNSNWTNEWEMKQGTMYVSCHCIAVQAHVSSVLFRSADCSFTAYYWNGSSWVQWASDSVSKSGAGSVNSNWYDNRLTGGDVNTRHQYCLHKIVITGSASGSADYFCRVRIAGIGRLAAYEGENGYNTDCKNQLMKYCNPSTYWTNESTFMSQASPGSHRGIQITNALANNLTRDDSGA